MIKADLQELVDRRPEQAADGAAILLREVTDGRIDPEQAWLWLLARLGCPDSVD